MSPADLVTVWRQQSAAYDRDGQPGARLLARCADELEEALRASDDASLTLTEAARVSGYSTDHLRRELREGHIPNAGRKHAPRIRRGDLPRKPGHGSDLTLALSRSPSAVQIARSVVNP